MLRDRVKCAVANPGGPIGVGSVVMLGAAPVGFRSFLAAFGAGQPAYFVLSDGAGKALGGIWTVNGDGTATITAILINDATGGAGSETFASACTAWCTIPSAHALASGMDGFIAKASPALSLRKTASGQAATIFGALNSTVRWAITLGDAAAESGSNAGSNFAIGRFSDTGEFIDSPLAFARSDGAPVVASPALWRTAIGAANIAGQTFTGAVGTSTGDITAQAGSLRAQLSGAPTNGEVILGNGSARLFYNGTQFDLNANLSVPVVAGGTGGNAGTLRTWGTANSVNFRWDSSHLLYRVDETLQRAIMFSPTGSAGLSEWRVMNDITPTGGTWAFFVLGFNSGGGPFSHVAGVAAGGTTVITGGASYAGFAWRIA